MAKKKKIIEGELVDGNGRKPAEDTPVIQSATLPPPYVPPQDFEAPVPGEEGLPDVPEMSAPIAPDIIPQDNGGLTKEELRQFREEEAAKAIPSHGFMFGVQDRYLPEATELNEREVFAFAVGDVQDAVLDPNRTESVFGIFKNKSMRNKISLNRKGRDEHVVLKQQEADRDAKAAAKGAWVGGNAI